MRGIGSGNILRRIYPVIIIAQSGPNQAANSASRHALTFKPHLSIGTDQSSLRVSRGLNISAAHRSMCLCSEADAASIGMPWHKFSENMRQKTHPDDCARGRYEKRLVQNNIHAEDPNRSWENR